jgi:choline dehydrogenase-like flavoprotein
MIKLLQNQKLVNWGYTSEPEAGSGTRAIKWPRGRTLGGSSSINGMLYVRGNPADFDGWAQMGARGWSFESVLPYFKMSETYHGKGEAEFRGESGPLQVEDYRTILPLTHRFIEAAQQAGHAFRKDLNGREQEGAGDHGDHERAPGPGQYLLGQLSDPPAAGRQAQHPQVHDHHRPHHQGDGDHMHGLEGRKHP